MTIIQIQNMNFKVKYERHKQEGHLKGYKSIEYVF
jgi:hypothetical protein